jgi:hypothetical protein
MVHIHTIFQPALRRLQYTSLLLIKFGMYPEWFKSITNLLVEAFGVCLKLKRLEAAGTAMSVEDITQTSVARTVLESARLLAVYAIREGQYDYLSVVLRRLVTPVGRGSSRKREPLLFWPLRGDVPGHDRIAHLWHESVRPYWLDFFGSEESYFDAACQLELILHLNSYLATQEPEGVKWVSQFRADIDFGYWYTSDLWRYSLDAAAPLAERIYESLASGPSNAFLLDLSIEHTIFQKVFQPTELSVTGNEQQIFVSYLKHLLKWQAQAAMTANRFARITDWGPVLTLLLSQN